MTPGVLVLSDDRMLDHDAGPGHPERAARLAAIHAELDRVATPSLRREAPRPATEAEILRVHTRAHLDGLLALRGSSAQLDPDTAVSPGSVDAALLSAGAAICAVEAVVRGEASPWRASARGAIAGAAGVLPEGPPAIPGTTAGLAATGSGPEAAFALGRPPGHHAEAEQAMGFCLLSNAAIAAAHAREALGVGRILVLDWDVHHGNGTQHAFYARSDVLVISAHRFPFYPGTGALEEVGRGEGQGYSVNLPLPARVGDAEYLALFRDVVLPVADTFRPELVLVSAGFDAHRDDPLGGMEVSEEGFAALCGIARGIARDHAGGRIALVLEGGYDLGGLARSVRACVEVLSGSTPPDAFGSPSDRGAAALRRIREWHRRYWPV